MRTARKTRSIAILATLGMLSAIGTSAAQDFEKTVKAARDGSVSIENVAGEVIVTGWDRDEVEVKATVGGRVEAVEVEVDEEGDVEIEVDVPDRMRGGYEADLTIRVPKGARLSVETVSAGIRVTDVAGLLELASVSGGIDVEADARSLEAVTVSGAIDVRGKFDRVEAESVSGQIDIRDASEEVEVSTTSGDIEVRGGPFRQVDLESVSGRITFDGSVAKDADISVDGFSGPVVLYLPADLDADIQVETFSGSIESDFDGRARREKYGPGAWFSTKLGNGSASIDVSSFSSSVRIEKR